MADEGFSYLAMVNDEGWGNGLHRAQPRSRPIWRSHGAGCKRHRRKIGEASSPSEQRPRRAEAERARPGDWPPPRALRRTHHGQHGARNDGEGAGLRLEPAAVAAPSSAIRNPLSLRISPMVYARLHDHLLEPTLHARANEGVLYPGRSGAPHAADEREPGHSVGSSSGPLQRRRILAKLRHRAF